MVRGTTGRAPTRAAVQSHLRHRTTGDTVKLLIVHDDFVPDSEMLHSTRDGWPAILANLKTLLETGDTLDLST